MDLIITTQQSYHNTQNFITDKFVRLANTCRLWLQVIYLDNISSNEIDLIMTYYNGNRQCEIHRFPMPYQEKPPPWVWKVWQEVLQKSCLARCRQSGTWHILDLAFPILQWHPAQSDELATPPDCSAKLQSMVNTLPPAYKQLIGEFTLPDDNGASLAQDLASIILSY